MRNPLYNDKGIALFIALMLTLMLSIVGLGIIKSSNDEVSIAGNELNEMKTFYAAQAGLDKATAAIQTQYEATGLPPNPMPSDTLAVNGTQVIYTTVKQDTIQKVLTKGSLAGLNALVTPYVVTATATDPVHNSVIGLQETFEVALVPIFQFSVFYETDLEIAPGPDMFLFGRVHSNRHVYLESDNNIDINSYFTAHGSIYHGRKPGSGMATGNGEVDIMGLDGSYHSMRQGSDWLDANDSYWFDTASTRWGGRVQDSSFGQEKLNLPLATPDSAHLIIDRASYGGGNSDSYESKATFKIMDGVASFYNGSSWVDVTSSLTTSGALKSTIFYDKREAKNATVYDLDMSKFKTSAYFPTNGIMYTADNRTGLRGTRIYNASDIGHPFTLASENPVYTKGNINGDTLNHQPMAIIADALTILSPNWSDDSTKTKSNDKTVRPATATTTNFSYITGNRETGVDGAAYNGGLENLPRFLENWSGKTLLYRGSIINLWLSRKGVGNWSGTYYSPPNRNWAFDNSLTDPNKLPPGTPMVRTFVRTGWRQQQVGYAAN